jgi:hypothetical protein
VCVVGLLFAAVACRHASRDDKLTAANEARYDQWIVDHKDVLTPADIAELNTARQQFRFKVMQAHPGLMSEDFANALYAELDGLTLHEILVKSYGLQIERMKVELLNYEPQLARFEAHQKNPDLTDEQKETVNAALEKLHRLMGEHEQELARLQKRLAELEQEKPVSK